MRLIRFGGDDWSSAVETADAADWLVLFEAWSAVEPLKGDYDGDALERDRRALITARKRGVDVIVVAHSGALPDWQMERDGWLDADALAGFGCYVDRLAHAFGELVKHWVGLWEPLGEAAIYEADQRKVRRALLDAQSTAWLHLRKAPGPGGGGTLVGVAERFNVRGRRRDQLVGRALGQVAGLFTQGADAREGLSRPAPHALLHVLASGKLAPPFGMVGELSGGTPAMDFAVAIQASVDDIHQIWRTGRAVFALGDSAVAARAEAEGVRVLGSGAAGVDVR